MKEGGDEKVTPNLVDVTFSGDMDSVTFNQKLHRFIQYVGGFEGVHNTTVNCIKFSPNGQYLASGADGNKLKTKLNFILSNANPITSIFFATLTKNLYEKKNKPIKN